jgi:CubicO group peptidase (beta-lactamase class C family)
VPGTLQLRSLAVLLVLAALACAADEVPSIAALALRPLATWNQAEREFAFPRMEDVAPGIRVVRRGVHVHALPRGAALPGVEPGGALDAAINRYIAEERLAGIVVLKDGKLRLERYALGDSPSTRWPSFSVAKSLTSTLVGAAVRDGAIGSIEDPLTRYIPELKGSGYEGVTVRQLLTMTSGVKWNEDYTDPKADVALFYETPPEPGLDATVSYMRHLTREYPPGQKWVYKTGETNLIGVLVERATHRSLADYLSRKIWAPYGMEADAHWSLDVTGHEQGGCCLQARLRDFARFGEFVLEGAVAMGEPVVRPDWLPAATRKQVDIERPGYGYGFQWWTRDDGVYFAVGIHGQLISIDSKRRVVIAMNSVWPTAIGPERLAARAKLLAAVNAAVDASP